MIGFADFAILVVVGTLCSLDTVSVAQVMISRPIVSATLGAAALGRMSEGLVIGAVMELFALETMPFGASRYPEWGSAGVAAGATYVLAGPGVPGALAIAVLAGLLTAALGSVSMVWHRKSVARTAGALREELASGSATAVARLHAAGISLDIWRGALVTTVGLVVAFAAAPRVVNSWTLSYGASVAVPVIVAVTVGAASLARSARNAPGAPWLLAGGLVVGSLVVALTR
jgi:mannose/fructose/N-acetylgalactosamine-specific phosphotransferase system component IIC